MINDPADLDDAIMEMLNYDGPVLFDCLVEKHENCFPMIPSGEPHNKMLLGDAKVEDAIGAEGGVLGSPTPVGGSVEGMICVSMALISLIRKGS